MSADPGAGGEPGPSAATVLHGVDAVRAAVGRDLGTSGWVTVGDDEVLRFAEATGDHRREHDAGRSDLGATEGRRGAPAFLTLALSNRLLPAIVEVTGVAAGLNRGTGRVRFPAPVPVGSRLRASATLTEAVDVEGGVDTTMVITLEAEGVDQPVCVIESLSRWLR